MEVKLKAVIDTNVLLSAIFFGGIPETIVAAAEHKLFQSITSDFLLAELSEKLIVKFGQSPRNTREVIERIKSFSKIFKITGKKIYKVRDLKDHPVVETAEVSGANFVVTGDKDLLDLVRHKYIHFVGPREFLSFIFPQIGT